MEIFTLLDELEEYLEGAKTIPFTNKGILDKEEILDIIKEIRLKLPDELKQAKWVKEERSRILVEANKEAEGIVSRARKEIIRERETAMQDIKSQASELAILIASKIMEEEVKLDKQSNLIDKFIDEVGNSQWQS